MQGFEVIITKAISVRVLAEDREEAESDAQTRVDAALDNLFDSLDGFIGSSDEGVEVNEVE